MEEFDTLVGFKYLKAMHVNDIKSNVTLGGNLDRHECLGKGGLHLDVFKWIMADTRIAPDVLMVLETPEDEKWKTEVDLLYSFCQPVKEEK
jgi:endonuclease IV